MKILNPQDTAHELVFIPRFYPVTNVNLILKNELDKVVHSYSITPIIVNGFMYLNFNQVFVNNTNYQLTVNSGLEIVYRGKLFLTNQADTTQDYKITKDIFL